MRFKVFGFAAALSAVSAMAEAPNPVDVIRSKDVELQGLLHEKDASQKTERIKTLINGIFDFEELGRRALGQARWAKMPAAQQGHFVKAFREKMESSSVKKLDAYVNDSTRYDAPDIRGEKATVTAHVFSKGSESIVVYKLVLKQNVWKAWDLVIDDLSTAANYGQQFDIILKTSTMDELIAKLEKGRGSAAPKSK